MPLNPTLHSGSTPEKIPAQLNPAAAPVEVIPCAVYDSVSLLRFNIAQRARASNFLEGYGYSQHGGVREAQMVPSVSSRLGGGENSRRRMSLKDRCRQGAELGVFRGAAKLLETKRPIVLFESFVGESQDEITRMLRRLKYTLYDCDLPAAERVPIRESCGHDTSQFPP